MSYYCIYDDEDVETQLKEKRQLIEFVKSLKNHEFEVYYQPKYDYKEKKIVGSEALVRLVQDGHVVPAGEFIEVAEKHGFTTYLDKYVLREVCKKITELKKEYIGTSIKDTIKKISTDINDEEDKVYEIKRANTKFISSKNQFNFLNSNSKKNNHNL